MITYLHIQNAALLEEVSVHFGQGLNVLSGETGAGKSILVDSINFLLGQRPVRDFVRTGSELAQVEGVIDFNDPLIEEGLFSLGIEAEDNQLVLSRTLTAVGKSVCKINGRVVPVGILKDAAKLLVDVHGQHEHQSLLDSAKQMQLLDHFCPAELGVQKKALESQLAQYRENARAMRALTGADNTREEQMEIWKFQLSEIEAAALKAGEEEDLEAKRNRLGSLDKLSTNTVRAISMLYSGAGRDGAAQDKVNAAVGYAAEIAKLDPARETIHTLLVEIAAQISDIIEELRDYHDELDADPATLEKCENRLDVIYKIKKKYGPTVEDVIKKRDKLQANLDGMVDTEAQIRKLKQQRKLISAEVMRICDAMNTLRTATASQLSEGITAVIKDLGMAKATFAINISRKTAFTPDGNDLVEFMISPNPGEPEKPLRRIASGGEMSRVMLAVKTVMADADRMDTVIFDEVDTGVSGRTAQQVAEKLAVISSKRQILCITHLPQIAAMADNHFLIEKSSLSQDGAERTMTTVTKLDDEKMTHELARLIGGAKITDSTMHAAAEMKQLANDVKKQH